MKYLVFSSFVCSILGLILSLIYLKISLNSNEWMNGELLKFLLLIFPIFQFWYTYRTNKLLKYQVFHETNSLDDFAMNDAQPGDIVVSNGFGLKFMLSINSALLTILFYLVASNIVFLVQIYFVGDDLKLTGSTEEVLTSISLILLPFLAIFAVGAIAFNLRTYALCRVITIK